jgi:hypothetical protein
METAKSKVSWLTETKLGLLAIIGNILFVIYIGIISQNDLKNLVLKHDEKIGKIEQEIGKLQDRKVDKETLQLILDNLHDMKSDISEMKRSLDSHVNKNQ